MSEKKPGVVATGDDTPHLIENVGKVPLSHVGQRGKLMNVLHVLTITKNLVLVRQIVDIWGPTQNVSLGGTRYFVSFIDDYTRHTWIYLIEQSTRSV